MRLMKINRQPQRWRSDAICVVLDKVFQSFSPDERLHFLGKGDRKKKKKMPILASDWFNFHTSPLNCNMLSLFSHQWDNWDCNKELANACNHVRKPQRNINPAEEGAECKSTNSILVAQHGILINVVNTNRKLHWPCFLITP